MKKITFGIIGTSDVAFRRFLPALMKSKEFEYVGVASREYEKTKKFVDKYGGEGFGSYEDLIRSNKVEAVYLPLPPALHYEWTKKALENGKHVLVEKPFTINYIHTKEILQIAQSKNLAVHENYMFVYHNQLTKIKEMIDNESIGKIRLYRIAFGFPMREADDFRYNRRLGGGALLDCGGYPIKLAMYLLGNTARIKMSKLNYEAGYEVDLFGSASFGNDEGQVAQISFGMDNAYKCELEVWGSKGMLLATRIFTAGEDFEPVLIKKTGNDEKNILLPADDQFLNSINEFSKCIQSKDVREKTYKQIAMQGKVVEKIIQGSGQ